MAEQMKRKKRAMYFGFKSIRNTMVFSFTLIIILALLIFLVFSVNYTENTVLENSKNYTTQLVDQVSSDIDSYISYMESISKMVTNHLDVTEYLYGDSDDDDTLKARIVEQFKTVLDTRSDIYNIAVIADNGKMVLNRGDSKLNPNSDISKMEWYQESIHANGAAVVSATHVQNVFKDQYSWVVTLSKGLLNPKTKKIEGIFFIDLNYSAIKSLCENISLGNKGYLFIVDKEGGIIYHPQQQLIYSGLKMDYIDQALSIKSGNFITADGKDSRLYTVCGSKETRWSIVGVSYMEELMEDKEEMQFFYVIIAVGLLALAVTLSILISKAITDPILKLKESMGEAQEGHFNSAVFYAPVENEIASLGRTFNAMTERIQELLKDNIREQKEKRKSELKVLQSQINPHFLYNTLDSIIWMAEGKKNQEVVIMTSSLAKLLRQSISNEDEIVTIAKELDYTRDYLTIQKMRYRDQLEFEIEVDDSIRREKIVKLVVQPIVENAIYHGIKCLDEKGMIVITGEKKDGKIILTVRDNGIGMEEEVRAHILENKCSGGSSNKVGVYNVHNRLQLYYGKEYGLSYESSVGIGTTVHIIIPGRQLEEDNG